MRKTSSIPSYASVTRRRRGFRVKLALAGIATVVGHTLEKVPGELDIAMDTAKTARNAAIRYLMYMPKPDCVTSRDKSGLVMMLVGLLMPRRIMVQQNGNPSTTEPRRH